MVGPNYRQPQPPRAKRYTEHALPAATGATPVAGGAAQRFVSGRDIPAEWWRLYRSPALDRLIRSALADSPTLAAARAALRAAQENLTAATSVLYPGVDAKLSAARQRSSGAAFGQPQVPGNEFNLYNASVNVSYALDVAGGARRELEALEAQIDYQRFQVAAAYLTLTANVVTAAVREASLRAQLDATRQVLATQRRLLGVLEKQLALGAISSSAVLAQRVQVAQTRALLPPLDKALAQTRHALAALIGRTPAQGALPGFDLDALTLPRELPVSVPSALLRQRPDIQAAEALLREASANIGVATAAQYPQLTLSASFGSAATRVADLFDSNSTLWSLGAGLLQPVFHAGELKARERAAVAAYDQARAQYRQTVLDAFQNVADVLRALETDAQALQAEADAEAAARASLVLARHQFTLGAVSYLALLDAQRQYEQARIALVQARAARYADTAALFQALGGGWWHDPAALAPKSDTVGSRNP